MASSVRFTTAAPLARRFRKVVVSRKGFSTMTSTPHSTAMGAKLMRPSPSIVVTIVSMITGPDARGAEPRQEMQGLPVHDRAPHRPPAALAGGPPGHHGENGRAAGTRAR